MVKSSCISMSWMPKFIYGEKPYSPVTLTRMILWRIHLYKTKDLRTEFFVTILYQSGIGRKFHSFILIIEG